MTDLSCSWDLCFAADPSWSICPSFEAFFLLVWCEPSLHQKAFGISHTVVCGVVTDDWREKCSAASSSMLPAANLHYWALRIQKHLLCISNCSHPAKESSVCMWGRVGWYERWGVCSDSICVPQVGMCFPLCASDHLSLGLSSIEYNWFLKSIILLGVLENSWQTLIDWELTGVTRRGCLKPGFREQKNWVALPCADSRCLWLRAPCSVPATDSPVTLGKSLSLCVALCLHK